MQISSDFKINSKISWKDKTMLTCKRYSCHAIFPKTFNVESMGISSMSWNSDNFEKIVMELSIKDLVTLNITLVDA
jgi:hypothetical protein